MHSALRAWIVVSLATIAAVPALAFDFIVTEYNDAALNVDPGCTEDHCTLREAVIAANAGVDADRILLSAGVYAINLVGSAENFAATGDLDLLNSAEIVGVGAGITVLDATGLGEAALHARKGGGAATFAFRKITVRNSTNEGLLLGQSTHTVEECEIRENGTGIFTTIAAVVTLRGSTVAGNTQSGLTAVQGSTTIESSTFSGNGQQELSVSEAVLFSCSHCTIADAADSDNEVSVSLNSTVSFTNSIVAGNCLLSTGGAISSSGGNVESPGNVCNFGAGTDLNGQTSVELDLAALADNGGATRTHLPGAASVANDNADTCPLVADQRGVVRATPCESGAVERTAAAVATPIFADGFLQGDTGAWSPPS